MYEFPERMEARRIPTVPLLRGYVLTNAASIENKGLEITLRWNNKINDNLSYNIGGNISFNKNNVPD